jgi:hypothetical protein
MTSCVYVQGAKPPSPANGLYLDMMKRVPTDSIFIDGPLAYFVPYLENSAVGFWRAWSRDAVNDTLPEYPAAHRCESARRSSGNVRIALRNRAAVASGGTVRSGMSIAIATKADSCLSGLKRLRS